MIYIYLHLLDIHYWMVIVYKCWSLDVYIHQRILKKKHSNVLDINNNNKCLLSSKSEYWKDWGAKEASLKKIKQKIKQKIFKQLLTGSVYL